MASTWPSPTATRLVPPPIDAPTSTGRVAAELLEHGDEVLDLGVLRVVAVGGPRRVAVAAGVEGDGAVAGLGQRLAGALPRVPGLAAAVLQHDERTVRVAPRVAGDAHP